MREREKKERSSFVTRLFIAPPLAADLLDVVQLTASTISPHLDTSPVSDSYE